MPHILRPQNNALPPNSTRAGSINLLRTSACAMEAAPTPAEVDTWESWLRVALVIDKALDENYGDFDAITTSIIAGGTHPDLEDATIKRCKDYLDNLPPPELQARLGGLTELKDTIAEYTQTTSAKRLVELRLDEANYHSSFFTLPLRNAADAPRLRFNQWVHGFNRTGYLVDSFVDLTSDYARGEISVRPTLSARATIGQAAVREAAPAIRLTPPSIILEAGRVAIRHVSA